MHHTRFIGRFGIAVVIHGRQRLGAFVGKHFIAAGIFSIVERNVGMIDQIVNLRHILGIVGHADTDRHPRIFFLNQMAQTTLRSILGQAELDELLSDREKINHRLQQ